MKTTFFLVSTYLIFSLFFSSCKKDINESVTSIQLNNTKSKNSPPYIFNWETASYLPTNPVNIVHVPWYGSVGGVNANIASDYKSSDGWALIYNTFSPTASPYLATLPPGGLYFALYNKYRGLLRFYLYLPSGIASSSSNITHGLTINTAGATSSILNFEGAAQNSDIVDVNAKTSAISKINNQQVQALGNWCVMQYEIAYDPNLNATSYPNLGLTWNSKAVNVTQVQLEGTNAGTITGEITQPASGFNLGGTLSTLATAGLEVYGLSDVAALQATATAGSQQANFLSGLSSAISGGLGNSIGALFSGIFGGNSSNSQEVNLKLNTTIALSGSLQNSFGLTSPNFVIPGQSNATTANGPNPAYTSSLGVFNLSQRPIIYAHKIADTRYENPRTLSRSGGWKWTYTIDNASFNLVFNPVVTNNATITGIKKDIIFTDYVSGESTLPGYPVYNFPTGITSDGTNVQIGDKWTIINPTTISYNYVNPGATTTPYFNTATIRVTFTVKPNNGAAPSLMTKTFLADVVVN